MVVDSGGNPYQARPAQPQFSNLRDSTYDQIPGRDFKAGYGPAWEFLGLWVLRLARTWTVDPQAQALWFRSPAALFDIGVIGVLIWLLRSRGLPSSRVLIYGWAPLPVWEFWANGHNDSVAIFL